MSRVQLALRVSDRQGAIDFYRSLFGVEPAKLRPGYANFDFNDARYPDIHTAGRGTACPVAADNGPSKMARATLAV